MTHVSYHYSWNMGHRVWLKITQLNLDIHITIWLDMEIISYLSIDELKGLSNEWFIRHNTWWRFCKWGCKLSAFNHWGNLVAKRAQTGVVLGDLLGSPCALPLWASPRSNECWVFRSLSWAMGSCKPLLRNPIVKHAQAGVVLGWVPSREVPMLHLCEHHLDPMSAKCSIYSHERWIHVESLLMKHGSMSLAQNHTVKSWYSHINFTCYGNDLLLIN